MKIRFGFVSNSSSANFIVNNSHKTVFDLAIAMLTIRNNDYAEWSDSYRITDTPEIDNINRAIRHGRDPNSSVRFSTANYDTFIKKVGEYYIVTTCNNHPFLHNLNGVVHCPTSVRAWLEAKEYLIEYDGPLPFTEELDDWKFQSKESFWSPKHDLEISRYDYLEAQRNGNKNAVAFCKDGDHFSDMMILSSTGEIICHVCYSRKREEDEP